MNKKQLEKEIAKTNIVQKNMWLVAEEIENEMQEQCQTAIEAFYNDYEPEYYNRLYALYDVYRTSVQADKTRNRVNVIIELNADFLTPPHKESQVEHIYTSAFVKGAHGGIMSWGRLPHTSGVYVTKPAPLQRILTYLDSVGYYYKLT